MNPNGDKSVRPKGEKSNYFVLGIAIMGQPIDHQTRCKHYHTPFDIVAIKFKCCDQYFPCYSCHEETVSHPVEVWRKEERDKKAVLCGVCGYEMTIDQYLASKDQCPVCRSHFNPNCSKHYHLYFQLSH